MHQRLLAVALFFGVCTPPVHSLRVSPDVYKPSSFIAWGKESIVYDALEKLEQQWPGGDKSKVMISAAVAGHPDFDHDVLRQKLSKKMHSQEPFIFAAFGSSVSAGHDNWPNHSWPFELERILKPTFQALDFDFEMRQRAMGGYGEVPYHGSCLAERAGEGEVDAVSWEFAMFNDPECAQAHFCKSVAAMDSKPAMIAFQDTQITSRFGEGREKRDHLRSEMLALGNEEHWHHCCGEENCKAPEGYECYQPSDWFFTEDFISNDEAQAYHEKCRSNDTWLAKGGVETAEEVEKMMHGAMSGWRLAEIAKATGVEGFYGVVPGVGAHFTADEPWYTAREMALSINWHPGPLGHKLMASQVAHFILTELHKELTGASFHVKAKGAGPTADNPLVSDGAKADDLLGCGTMVTQTCRSGVEPSSRGLSAWKDVKSSSQDSWQLVDTSDNPNWFGHQIDYRNAWRGNTTAGEMELEVEVPEGDGQYVVFCGAPCGWACPDHTGYVSTKSQEWWDVENKGPRKDVSDLEFKVDGSSVNPDELLSLHKQFFDSEEGQYCAGCELLGNICQPAKKLSPGKHKIGLQVKPSSEDDEKMFVDILQMMLVA